MEDSQGPRNRKERRAAAHNAGRKTGPREETAADIPMAQPDRSGPKAKTLYELAAERQALLEKGQPFKKTSDADGVRGEASAASEDPLGPFGDAVFFTLSLSMLHFTLDVLVYHQYRQDIAWDEIFARTTTVLPILFFLIYMLHTETASKLPVVKQLFFLSIAVTAGCYMVFAGNTYDYFAVMKRAPPVGTLWIWSVIEMRLPYAVASLVAVGGFMWTKGFTVF
ncbi:hypothetical protein LTR66_002384 [Elasticomyces elasticus]|nr:hypothetical protein LTR66_002384 [Elasticomyces elasticus]